MLKMLKAMSKSKKGQGMVEYGLIIGLIAVVVIAILGGVGQKLVALFTQISGALPG
jgi:pilus assembly protein Flp/PilA